MTATASEAGPATDPGTAAPPPAAPASTVLTGAAATRAARFQRAAAVLDRPAAPAKSAESATEPPAANQAQAEKPKNLSSDGVRLKKLERDIRARESAVEAARAEAARRLEAAEAERATVAKEQAEFAELRRTNPREAARRLGLTLRDFADEHVRQSESETARQIRELKERAEADRKEREARDAEREREIAEARAHIAKREAERIERDDREWIAEAWEPSSAQEFPFLAAFGGSPDAIIAAAYRNARAEFDKRGTVDRAAVLRAMDKWCEEEKSKGNWTEAQLKRFAPKPLPAAPRTAPKRPATRNERLERARRVMKGER